MRNLKLKMTLNWLLTMFQLRSFFVPFSSTLNIFTFDAQFYEVTLKYRDFYIFGIRVARIQIDK